MATGTDFWNYLASAWENAGAFRKVELTTKEETTTVEYEGKTYEVPVLTPQVTEAPGTLADDVPLEEQERMKGVWQATGDAIVNLVNQILQEKGLI